MKALKNKNGWSHFMIFIMVTIMAFAITSCSNDVKIELTPNCLTALNELSRDAAKKELNKNGWTRKSSITHVDKTVSFIYSKNGIDGNIEIPESQYDGETVKFQTESAEQYKQWYNELENLGYKFTDNSKYGNTVYICENDSEKLPNIVLAIIVTYSDDNATNPSGEFYEMWIDMASDKDNK